MPQFAWSPWAEEPASPPCCAAPTRHVHAGRHTAARSRNISDLAAVVTVTDDGGSSGRLRKDFNMLPPGDLRNCMVALSDDEHLLSRSSAIASAPAKRPRRPQLRQPLRRRAHRDHRRLRPGHPARPPRFLPPAATSTPSTTANVTLCRAHGRRHPRPRRNQHHRQQTPHRRAHARARPTPIPSPRPSKPSRRADLITIGPGSLYTSADHQSARQRHPRSPRRKPAPSASSSATS